VKKARSSGSNTSSTTHPRGGALKSPPPTSITRRARLRGGRQERAVPLQESAERQVGFRDEIRVILSLEREFRQNRISIFCRSSRRTASTASSTLFSRRVSQWRISGAASRKNQLECTCCSLLTGGLNAISEDAEVRRKVARASDGLRQGRRRIGGEVDRRAAYSRSDICRAGGRNATNGMGGGVLPGDRRHAGFLCVTIALEP